MSRAVTILGFGATAYDKANSIEDNCVGEIWTLNNFYESFPNLKPDRVFELHNVNYLATFKPNNRNTDHATMLDQCGATVFLQEEACTPSIRKAVAYPFEQVVGHFSCNYFLGSPSWMLALAIMEGVTHIRSWGIDTIDDQHKQQRASWAFWICMAKNYGLTMDGSSLNFLSEPEQDVGLEGVREQALHAHEEKLKRVREEKAKSEAPIAPTKSDKCCDNKTKENHSGETKKTCC